MIPENIKSVLRLEKQSPEFINLVNYVDKTFDVVKIEGVYYQGSINTSEFITYNNKKLYLCSCLIPTYGGTGAATVNASTLTTYDEFNVAQNTFGRLLPVWNTTAAAIWYTTDQMSTIRNFFFSRIVPTGYFKMIFNGYKLTLK